MKLYVIRTVCYASFDILFDISIRKRDKVPQFTFYCRINLELRESRGFIELQYIVQLAESIYS